MYFSRHEGNYGIFSIPNKTPLFQEELATILEAKLQLTRDNFEIFEKESIKLKLFYSNGIKTHEFRLKETFRYKNREISYSDFIDAIRSATPNKILI